MNKALHRRKFIKTSAITGLGLSMLNSFPSFASNKKASGKRIGIIGLDTSHATAFVEALNGPSPDAAYDGYKVTAAYPQGSKVIKSSYERIPKYTEEVKKFGVEIVSSIEELLKKADVIMLETNDGNPHLEQALQVMKAGKTLWIDKPVAASLSDVLTIFDAAKKYKVPVFSASSLRYATNVQETASGQSAGKIIGADTYSPCPVDSTHPDFFWYGIHGIEILTTVMGKGCKSVSRVHTEDTDVITAVWIDGRIGTFHGNRKGPNEYGGTAIGEKAVVKLGPYGGYEPLLKQIIQFFNTGISPVPIEDTIELYTLMEAADESKRRKGAPVLLADVLKKAMIKKKKIS